MGCNMDSIHCEVIIPERQQIQILKKIYPDEKFNYEKLEKYFREYGWSISDPQGNNSVFVVEYYLDNFYEENIQFLKEIAQFIDTGYIECKIQWKYVKYVFKDKKLKAYPGTKIIQYSTEECDIF